MVRSLPWLGFGTLALALGCTDASPLPPRASGEELARIFQENAAELRDTPRGDRVRSFGLFFEQADGSYAEQKGAVLILPQEDESLLIGYYMPHAGGDFERIGEPVRLSGTRVPHVGNPRGSATCLRAPLLDRPGEWFGCVERGRVVTGVE